MIARRQFLAAGMRRTLRQKQVGADKQKYWKCAGAGYVVAGADGFIGSSSPGSREAGAGNPATILTKDFSSYYPPPPVAPIYCAGNYGLFTPGCISYRGPAPGDFFPAEGEVFQRLTDVYNQLDHPQTTSSYNTEESTEEKMILDLVFDDEQN